MNIDWDELVIQLHKQNVTGVRMVLESHAYSFYREIVEKYKQDKFEESDYGKLYVFLQALDYIYISGDISPLRDAEYDELHAIYHEKTGKSITNKLESGDNTKRVKHVYPRLKGTLEKVHYVAENDKQKNAIKTHKSLETWLRDRLEKLPKKQYALGFFLKFDGISVVFALENGKVVSAITRGDADTGEGKDVTNNFRNVEFGWVPGVNTPAKYGVKTEVVMTKKDFERYSKKYKSDTRKLEDPRSAASGLVNADYLPPELLKYLSIIDLQYCNEEGEFWFPSTYPCEGLMETYKIIPVDENFDIEYIRLIINHMKDTIDNYPINCDGVVVRFLDKSAIKKLGRDENRGINKFEIAFKFPPEEKETVLLNVEFQVGLLGTISPVAKVAPVKMKGKTISSISLGSIDRMNGLKLRLGDKVIVKYEIIPYLDKIQETEGNDSPIIEPPEVCPYCGEKLEYNPVLMCVNTQCPSRVMGKINNYCVKMNIKGIGPAIIEDFFNAGLLTCIEDLYRLEDKGAAIIELDGYGKKKFETITKSIRKHNETDAATLLGSLGIKSVGRTKFSKIVDIYYIDDLMAMTEKDIPKLCEIQGVQESTAVKIIEGLRENRETIEYLLTKVKLIKKKEGKYNIVFSGVRNREFEKHLEDLGYQIKDSVNKDTKYVVVESNETNTTKTKRAEELGIPKLVIQQAYQAFGF